MNFSSNNGWDRETKKPERDHIKLELANSRLLSVVSDFIVAIVTVCDGSKKCEGKKQTYKLFSWRYIPFGVMEPIPATNRRSEDTSTVNEPPTHCRALCEQLSVLILAQGYLGGAPWFCSTRAWTENPPPVSPVRRQNRLYILQEDILCLMSGRQHEICLRIFLVILKSTDVYSYVKYWATLRLCVFSLTLWSGMRQSSTPSWRRNSPTSCVTWPRLPPGSIAMTYRSPNACCPTSWPLRPSRAALGSPLLRTRISMR